MTSKSDRHVSKAYRLFQKAYEKLLINFIYPIASFKIFRNSKSVFIDCGAYDGCSAVKASLLYPFIDQIISFEADTRMWSEKASRVSTLIPCAVWIEDSLIDFQIITKNKYGKDFAGAGSLIKDKQLQNEKVHQQTEIIKVPSIDLSEWISKNYFRKDKVILKLDVEGAEYQILEKIMDKGLHKTIDILYIEWHPNYSSFTEERTEEITQEVYKNFKKVINWDALPYSLIDNARLS